MPLRRVGTLRDFLDDTDQPSVKPLIGVNLNNARLSLPITPLSSDSYAFDNTGLTPWCFSSPPILQHSLCATKYAYLPFRAFPDGFAAHIEVRTGDILIFFAHPEDTSTIEDFGNASAFDSLNIGVARKPYNMKIDAILLQPGMVLCVLCHLSSFLFISKICGVDASVLIPLWRSLLSHHV